jgi:phosphoribosylformylglycinamidine synthase
MENLSTATRRELVRACHDCSEGGIGVAVAEMAFAGGLGASINLKEVPLGESIDRDDFILFSESNSRFIVEVAPDKKDAFEKEMAGTPFALIGQVINEPRLDVYGQKGNSVISISINELKEAWQKPLRW